MAGGGQTRIPTDRFIDPSPMGGAMQTPLRGTSTAVMPSMLPSDAANYPKRGEEGSFYNQPSQTLDAQGNLSPMISGAIGKDGMPVTGISDITPLPGPPMSGGKGGGNGEMPRPTPAPAPSTQYSPMAAPAQAQPQGFDVNQAAAGGLQQAFQGTEAAMQGPNIGQFMNPYTKQVTQNTLTDLERQRQMQMNTLGAQASNAKAFGGSRHGVAEALTNEGFARQGAQTFGNLQQQGFNTALQAAQNQQQMQMGGAAQLGQLGQQAFGTSQAIQQQQGQQGLLQQGIQQALIDAAKQQYAGYTEAPTAALNAPLAALGVTPVPQSQTNSMKPGLFNYLQLGAGMMP